MQAPKKVSSAKRIARDRGWKEFAKSSIARKRSLPGCR